MAEGQNTENTYHSKDKRTNSCKTQVIRLVDITLACLILAPVVVIYWRTTWLLMDFYIYPQHHMTSACISLVVGFASSLLIVLCQRDFMTFLCEFDELISKIIWKMCMYPISVSCVSYWRGVWMVTDLTTTISLTSLILCHSLSFVLLSVLRTASSVVSAPGFYVNDLHVSISTVTITNIPWSRDKYAFIKYIVNCLLTVSIVGTLVVVFWRGTWLLWDLITDFDTTNNVYDHLLCYGISSGICTICYLISRPFELFLINSTSCPTWFKIVLEHVFVYVLACCSVNIWRSAWYIWDLLFLTGKSKSS